MKYIKEYNIYEKLRTTFHMQPRDIEEFLADIPSEEVIPKIEVELVKRDLIDEIIKFIIFRTKSLMMSLSRNKDDRMDELSTLIIKLTKIYKGE